MYLIYVQSFLPTVENVLVKMVGWNNSLCNHMSSYNCYKFVLHFEKGQVFYKMNWKVTLLSGFSSQSIIPKKKKKKSIRHFYTWICQKEITISCYYLWLSIFSLYSVLCFFISGQTSFFKSSTKDDKLGNFSHSRMYMQLAITILFVLILYQHPFKTNLKVNVKDKHWNGIGRKLKS